MKVKFHKSDILTGLITIVAGYLYWLFGPVTMHGQEVAKELGFLIIGVGLIIILPSKNRKTFIKKEVNGIMKCTGCNKIYPKRNVAIPICPICDGKLEDIDSMIKES